MSHNAPENKTMLHTFCEASCDKNL